MKIHIYYFTISQHLSTPSLYFHCRLKSSECFILYAAQASSQITQGNAVIRWISGLQIHFLEVYLQIEVTLVELRQ
jgi:hypothetical protein